MNLSLVVFGGIAAVILAALSRGEASRGASPADLVSARLIVAARLRQIEEERAERFRRYHLAWAVTRRAPRTSAHGYVLPFASGERRGQ